MKFFATVFLVTAAWATSLYAQAGPGTVKLGRIQLSVTNTPEYQLSGGIIKRFVIGKWLEIEVPFDTAPDVIDQLTFNYTVLLAGKLLDGTVTHVDISKGKEHYSVMYISPHAIQRLLGGRAMSGGDVQNVWVEVTSQGQVIDRASLKPGAIPNLQHLQGQMVNKSQTPFAPLYGIATRRSNPRTSSTRVGSVSPDPHVPPALMLLSSRVDAFLIQGDAKLDLITITGSLQF